MRTKERGRPYKWVSSSLKPLSVTLMTCFASEINHGHVESAMTHATIQKTKQYMAWNGKTQHFGTVLALTNDYVLFCNAEQKEWYIYL